MNALALILIIFLILSGKCFATPSTQIWDPSTDIQPTGVWHCGIDNYFTLKGPSEGGYAFPTNLGITYGLLPGLEIGVDAFLPQREPLAFNAKYGIPESGKMPAFAFGGFGFGTESDVTDQNVLYAVAAKTFPFGRVSAGWFSGNKKLLLNPDGSGDNAGVLCTWDKAVTDKLWLCVDYASTKSALGAFFFGVSWLFAPNVSVIFGYGTYNNGVEPTGTTQLDINI